MTTHELKCWPDGFSDLVRGVKTFEVRIDDRGYQVGDLLILREWVPPASDDPEIGTYTGQAVSRVITYVYRGNRFGAPVPLFCGERPVVVLGIAPSGEELPMQEEKRALVGAEA